MKRLLVLLAVVCSTSAAQIPHYRLILAPAVLDSLAVRDIFSNSYLPATFNFGDSTWTDAKVRYQGKSNRFFSKKPIRVRFPKDHLFQRKEHLVLHAMYTDRSFLREKLAWDLFEEMGELAPHASFARLSINGKLQGLYLEVDKVDKWFLKERNRTVSSVYNADGYYSLADMTVQHTALLKFFYPKEAGDKEEYDDLYDLLTVINQTPDSSFERTVDSLFDMNSVYNWLAGNILTMMGDSYNKNYFLYRDMSRQAHQWIIIPWDYDVSFGTTGDPAVPYPQSLLNQGIGYTFPPLSGPANVLKDRLMQSKSMSNRLRMRVDTLLHTIFTNEHLNRHIDSLAALIRSDVAADPQKPGTLQDFEDGVEGLKFFVTARRNFLLKTYVQPATGDYDQVMLKHPAPHHIYDCVGFDGEQFATIELFSARRLDSLLVVAYPDSMPPGFDTVQHPGFLRRFFQIVPYPARATFTGRLELWYYDLSKNDREVSSGTREERSLKSFVRRSGKDRPMTSTVNPSANVFKVPLITNSDCGSSSCFVFYVPSP